MNHAVVAMYPFTLSIQKTDSDAGKIENGLDAVFAEKNILCKTVLRGNGRTHHKGQNKNN